MSRQLPSGVAALAALVVLTVPSLARADELAEARTFIGNQVKLIKSGDVDGLKDTVTDRLKGKITDELLRKAQAEVSKASLYELVGSVSSENGGLKVKMASGRTLTTLIKAGGSWRADTLWFK